MKFRFPNIDVCLKHNLSYIYQGLEEFNILVSENAKKLETFVRDSYSKEWKLRSRKMYKDSVIVSDELYDEKGDLEFTNCYELSENTLTARFEDSRVEWTFNKEGCLEKEMRIYENDGNSSWDFRMDAENTLIGINKYKIEKLNKYTISVCDSEYDRHEIKEILFDEETGVIQTTDYEDLMSTIYLDENERVIRRIDKYGQETITNYESEYSSKTYSKDKAGSLSLVFEFNQLFEENKIIKYRKSYGETIRDVKEVTYLK